MSWQTFIPGRPKPQGSKTSGVNRKTGKTFVREDNAGTKPWRKIMVEALQDDRGVPLARFESAIWVRLRFVFLRPKSHAPNSLPTSKALGDVDKLTRNVLDALTQAGVITDDKFVVCLRDVEKIYGPNPGVHIEVGPQVPNPFSASVESLLGVKLEPFQRYIMDEVISHKQKEIQMGTDAQGNSTCDKCGGSVPDGDNCCVNCE